MEEAELASPSPFSALNSCCYNPSGVGTGEQKSSYLANTIIHWLCAVQSGMMFKDDSCSPGDFSGLSISSPSPHPWKPVTCRCLAEVTHSSLDCYLFFLQLLGLTKDQPDHTAGASLPTPVSKLKFSHSESSLTQQLRCFPFQIRILTS